MSDGVAKLDEEGSPNEGSVKRAGRARICKECRFTTTDVREFSNHRLHAHAEENTEDKTVTRKNSLRRKSSASTVNIEEQKQKEQNSPDNKQKTTDKSVVKLNITKPDTNKEIETQDNSKQESMEDTKTLNTESKIEEAVETKMETEKISDELLNSLALAPRKSIDSPTKIETENKFTEKVIIQKQNGLTEEVLLVNNKDDDFDDEPRLVIADEMENGDIEDGSDPPALCRSGNIQNRSYLCNNCDFMTTNAKGYLHHQKDAHNSDIIIYECDICDYATKYKQKLPRHRKLHFKEGQPDSDLDLSLNERELYEMRKAAGMDGTMNGNDEMDDLADDIEMEEDEEEMVTLTSSVPEGVAAPVKEGAPIVVEKKKRVRQEVDPLKYFEVVDEVGVKYACSKCGNVYKWRKSLNKHWKEKHFGELPDLTKPPPTLQNYTLFSRYKAKFGGQPPPPAAPNVVYGAAVPSPTNQLKNRSTPTNTRPDDDQSQPPAHMQPQATPPPHLSNVVMPRQIGPFIAGTNQNTFNNPGLTLSSLSNQMRQQSRTPENHHEIRQMMNDIQNKSRAEQARNLERIMNIKQEKQNSPQQNSNKQNEQMEPLDFSKPLNFSKKSSDIKSEPSWGDTNSETDSLQEMPISMATNQIAMAMRQSQNMSSSQESPSLQCNKCSFVAKTLTDYSSHMSLHLNKRAFKCAECQSHFNGVEDLNKHFFDNHSEKIQEHKEAIQKIPHGLQQTYHLLKMPLDSISNLSSQELLSNEPKQLKCSMCAFVAKWPAELQKHAVSHSEERPFICMVCASTYKWKWDLVKHFEKSHSSLPNPYKRREGGGVLPTVNSPSTPPLDAMSKTTAALFEASYSNMNFMLDEDSVSQPPSKKRRMSDSEMQVGEEFYRELLEKQIRQKRENTQSETPPPNLQRMLPRPSSNPDWKSNGEYASEMLKMKTEEYLMSSSFDSQTPNRHITEALKQRITSGKQLIEEKTPVRPDSADSKNGAEVPLPYKCQVCEYRARWPSEISQHMKNHSNEKPYHCPRCSYKSKWKWDVVKHLRRCGGGTVNDVIDTTKIRKMAPPNVMVLPQSNLQQQQSQHIKQQLLNQPVFPGQQQRSRSMSPARISPAMSSSSSSNVDKIPQPNFSVAVYGQDHPENQENADTNNSNETNQSNGKQPVFRSLVNQGIYHCLECPFVGNSPAELRRHTVLHSENKPFTCTMCGYSSRWKCDLKKHMKVYGHYSNGVVDSSDEAEAPAEVYMEMSEDSDEEKSTLYMCPQCPYNSYKKQAYEHHLRIHANLMEGDSQQSTESSPKFKCTKCTYTGNDLSSFLQHKRSHNNQQESSNMSSAQSELGNVTPLPSTLHLKHRRKPVKQFRCNKCPYVCFKREGLINHDSMHEPRGTDAYLCIFCDYNVFSKNLLLQHMRLHPEYNPAECSELEVRVSNAELMEMEELEEKEIANEELDSASALEENNNNDDYESGFDANGSSVLDFSKISPPFGGRSSTPQTTQQNTQNTEKNRFTSNNISPTNNNSRAATNSNTSLNGTLPCEWCPATFPNVVSLYQHAQSLHPMQLKAQEAGDMAASQAPTKTSQLEQIVRERQREYQVYHQFMARQQPQIQQQIQSHLQAQSQSLARRYVPLAPKPQAPQQSPQQSPQQQPQQTSTLPQSDLQSQGNGMDNFMNQGHNQGQLSPTQMAAIRARKSASQQKQRARSFQCTKCTFTAPNAVTYLRHIERHGSNCKHTCLYCDYSIDRLNLLYQHMKGTHGSKWQGTTEEKINLSVHGEDSNNNIIDMLEDNSMSEDLNASFNSSHNDSLEGDIELRSQYDSGALSAYKNSGIKPVLVLREEILWRSVPVQICSLDGRKHYKCPKCFYINSNAANTSNHVRQHGRNLKHKCNDCDYSVDNFKHMQHHVETIHPKDPNFVLKLSQQPSILIDDFPSEINNNNNSETANQSTSKITYDIRQSGTPLTCPKCPYKAVEKEKLRLHLERHRYNGKFECQLCDFSVDKYSYLRQHAKLHKFVTSSGNANIEMDQGNDNEMSYEDEAFSKLRSETAPAINVSLNEKLRFKCSCCPFFTFSKLSILNHRRYHITKSHLSCQLCSFSTDESTQLLDHMKFHQSKPAESGHEKYHDVTLDPYNESYKLLQQLPSDNKVVMEFGDDGADSIGEFDEALGDNDVEEDDDIEMAMMEEELRDTMKNMANTDATTMAERNLNSEGAFDSELQFRNYKCKDCPYSSNSNSEFQKHCRLHGTNYKFKCDYCNYSLERVNLISQHRKLHFMEPGYQQAPLMARLLNKNYEDYENILARVGNEIAFPPTESNVQKQAENVDTSSYHGNKIPGGNGSDRYACNKCPYKGQVLKGLKSHMQMHGLVRKYKCDYCDWGAERLNLLYQHRRVHDNEPDFNSAPSEIVLLNRDFILDENLGSGVVGMATMEYSESPFASADLQHLQTPKKNQLGQKIHYCKMCPFSTENVNTYSFHKKLHCIQACYNCSECSYSIDNITSLKEHIRLHKKEREMMRRTLSTDTNTTRHKCPKCPYSSPNKTLLVNHAAMHSSGRKYGCTQCDFSSDKQALIALHIKVHDDNYTESDSMEEIDLMMKRTPDVIGPQLYFSSPNKLDIDSDSNDSSNPDHVCDKCPFSTPSKEELGSHSEHHESKSKHTCMYCTFSCSKDEELLQHMQVHFPSTTIDKDMIKALKRQGFKRNITKAFGDGNEARSSENQGEPDSTVNETLKEESEEKMEVTQTSDNKNNLKDCENKTKVYVCQYCEREFDCKTSMLTHEKQHLVGSQF